MRLMQAMYSGTIQHLPKDELSKQCEIFSSLPRNTSGVSECSSQVVLPVCFPLILSRWLLWLTQNTSLPDNVSTELGALIEPLSVAIHGVRRAALDKDADVLVIGAGAVGLLACGMLRFHGARTVTVCDLVEQRVYFATNNDFADRGFTVYPGRASSTEEALGMAKAMSSQALKAGFDDSDTLGFDAVFECTGAETCTQAAIYVSECWFTYSKAHSYRIM